MSLAPAALEILTKIGSETSLRASLRVRFLLRATTLTRDTARRLRHPAHHALEPGRAPAKGGPGRRARRAPRLHAVRLSLIRSPFHPSPPR